MSAGSSSRKRGDGKGSNGLLSAGNRSSKVGMGEVVSFALTSSSTPARALLTRSTSMGSLPTKIWLTPVLVSRWITAAGELRGEMVKTVAPVFRIPIMVRKNVIDSARGSVGQCTSCTDPYYLPVAATIATIGGRSAVGDKGAIAADTVHATLCAARTPSRYDTLVTDDDPACT